MNIIEQEAKNFITSGYGFYKDFYNTTTLQRIKSELNNKLNNFNQDKDKLDFLKIISSETSSQITKHRLKCKKEDCHYEKERETGLFVFRDEILEINKNYKFEAINKEKFTEEEEINTQVNLNKIIEHFNNVTAGQEVLYNEIEDLKNHFNLGKKTWKQLLLGKMVGATAGGLIEMTLAKEIYDNATLGIETGINYLEKL